MPPLRCLCHACYDAYFHCFIFFRLPFTPSATLPPCHAYLITPPAAIAIIVISFISQLLR